VRDPPPLAGLLQSSKNRCQRLRREGRNVT
jgi:hypothetical protein